MMAATQRVIVVTKHAAPVALQHMRGDDFDPTERPERYNLKSFQIINGFAADLDDSEIAALKSSPEVAYIEPDLERHAMADSIVPGQQVTPYGVKLVQAPQTWPTTRGRSFDPKVPIRVAIIDTGIDYNSPELTAAFQGGTDLVNNDNDPMDDAGHGTHVAGIIAAADNGNGVIGVAPDVELYSVKVLDCSGSGSSSNIIAALDWVKQQKQQIGGNWIINLSLGSQTPSNSERAAFQAASDAGILIFAASGNDFAGHPNNLSYPAGYPSVVSVGAIDSTSTISSFSQRGPGLKVVAPGVSVLSTYPGATVKTDDGRTFAATLPTITDTGKNTLCPAPLQMSGTAVYCGFGAKAGDFPSAVSGKIALISRGNNTGAGTISTKAGSTVVTGNGTSFLSDFDPDEIANGTASISICGQNSLSVAAVTSNTSLTLSAAAQVTLNNTSYIPGATFARKAKNAKTAGAAGVIVFNHDICGGVPVDLVPGLTLNSANDIPPFVFISENDGLSLKSTPAATVNAFGDHGFALLDGTSMACPHAVAVAALAWSVSPGSKNTDVADAIEKTATDLGDAGTDNTYGFGLVNARAVVDMLKTSNPAQTPAATGRPPGRRGR